MIPKTLSINDIEEILDAVIPIENNLIFVQRDVTAKRIMLENIRSDLREQLRYVKINPDATNELIDTIKMKIIKGLSQPGTPIGMVVSEMFGQEVTQAVLNSKKSAGAGQDFAGSLAAINGVVAGSKGAIMPASIFFTNPYFTGMDIYRMKAFFTYVKFQDLITADTYLMKMDNYDEEWWFSIHKQLNGDLPFEPGHVIRAYLDMKKIYNHQVTLNEIVKAINNQFPKDENVLYPVISPLTFDKPFVDIFVNSVFIENFVEKETGGDIRGAVEVYFNNIFLDVDIHIKGIPHLINMRPEKVETRLSIMDSVKMQLSNEDHSAVELMGGNKKMTENLWYVKLDTFFMNKYGIPKEKLERLIESVGMDIIPIDEEITDVLVVKTDGDSPDKILIKAQEKVVEEQDKIFTEAINNRTESFPETSEVYKLIYHFFAWGYVERIIKNTSGFNINPLLSYLSKYKIIDINRCFSGDLYENLEFFGVIGLRNFLVEKVPELISATGGTPIHTHIDTMIRYMCKHGSLNKFKNVKHVERESGAASSMLYQKAHATVKESAAAGITTGGNTVAGAKILNMSIKYGTGISGVITERFTKSERELILESKKKGMSNEEIQNLLNERRKERHDFQEEEPINSKEESKRDEKKPVKRKVVSKPKVSIQKEKEVISSKEEENKEKESKKPQPKKRTVVRKKKTDTSDMFD